ncbi:efflux RND transporter permease subunit [Endozoicomonas numazuensis]|uniref:Uncharacterized protein n=1 Tax=Endozoicomonas numazuensis TaxID=1137799 RepID=A0A081NMB3_9GAMM|nr:efflux RND transporter permease subunit [Endozoicomonas numazuensis]KEQ19586.1 hypothetical protein GZ78_06690 [Endozoicomonas numazuensis]
MFTPFFLRRPRLAQVIALVILISGLLCLPLIPTLEYPQVTLFPWSEPYWDCTFQDWTVLYHECYALLYTHGAGMQARKSLGTPIFWGMLAVIVIATLMTPAFYLILRNTKRRFQSH